MVLLICAVVGLGGLIPADVDANETVGDLKKHIQAGCSSLSQVYPSLLTLHLARRSSALSYGTTRNLWLRVGDEDAKALARGEEMPAGIRDLMSNEVALAEASRLDADECLGAKLVPIEGDIHILVKSPAKANNRVRSSKRTLLTSVTAYGRFKANAMRAAL